MGCGRGCLYLALSCHSLYYADASSNTQCIQRCVGVSDGQGTGCGGSMHGQAVVGQRSRGMAEPLCMHGLLAASSISLINSGKG